MTDSNHKPRIGHAPVSSDLLSVLKTSCRGAILLNLLLGGLAFTMMFFSEVDSRVRGLVWTQGVALLGSPVLPCIFLKVILKTKRAAWMYLSTTVDCLSAAWHLLVLGLVGLSVAFGIPQSGLLAFVAPLAVVVILVVVFLEQGPARENWKLLVRSRKLDLSEGLLRHEVPPVSLPALERQTRIVYTIAAATVLAVYCHTRIKDIRMAIAGAGAFVAIVLFVGIAWVSSISTLIRLLWWEWRNGKKILLDITSSEADAPAENPILTPGEAPEREGRDNREHSNL